MALLKILEDEMQLFQIFAILAIDNVWFLRNEVIHESVIPSPTWLIHKISKVLLDHTTVWTETQKELKIAHFHLPEDQFILQFDIAVRKNGTTTANICRTGSGTLFFALISLILNTNPIVGEATTVLLWIQEARNRNMRKMWIEGDLKQAIYTIQKDTSAIDWEMQAIA